MSKGGISNDQGRRSLRSIKVTKTGLTLAKPPFPYSLCVESG